MRPSSSLLSAGEDRLLIDKAEGISERIDGIETSLAPGPGFDLRVEFGKSKLPRPREKGFEIFDREIDVIRVGPGIKQIAIRTRIEAGEDHAVAIEVMPPGADALARLPKERAVELGRGFDVGYREDDAEKFHVGRKLTFPHQVRPP